jgi:hypothetical protein
LARGKRGRREGEEAKREETVNGISDTVAVTATELAYVNGIIWGRGRGKGKEKENIKK